MSEDFSGYPCSLCANPELRPISEARFYQPKTICIVDCKRALPKQFSTLPMAIAADLKKDKLTATDVCVYAFCLAKAGANGYHWWTNGGLAELTGFDESTIKGSLKKLETAGFIKRVTVRK